MPGDDAIQRERECRACNFRDVVMSHDGDETSGLCRRCSYLAARLAGHEHPRPAVNGKPVDFTAYPPIGDVLTVTF